MQTRNHNFEPKNTKFQVSAEAENNFYWNELKKTKFHSEIKQCSILSLFKNNTQTSLLKRSLFICFLLLLNFNIQDVSAQCSSCISAATCTGGNGPVSNGTNINSGQTYYYSSTGSLGASINLNGGTLRICGNLTLSGINFNSGNIVVEAGGTLTINGGGTLYLNGNSRIYNRGTLNINRNVAMQNNNNLINNCSSSSILNMNSGSHMLEINSSSSYFTNAGTANIHTLFLQSNAPNNAVCLGASSSMVLTNLNNNKSNGINAPSGPACVRYTANAALNNSLSNSSNVVICRASGSTTSGGAGFGSASVNVNCPSCLTALPITLIDFAAKCNGKEIVIDWTVSNEINNKEFSLEKSYDGLTWQDFKSIKPASQGNEINTYSVTTENEYKMVYYRLKQTDHNGVSTTYDNVVSTCDDHNKLFSIYPNPANNSLNIVYKDNLNDGHIIVLNTMQEIVYESFEKQESINIENLCSGIYFLKNNGQVIKFVVER